MPEPGYTSVTVRDEIHELLKKFAEERFMTVPKAIEYLIKKELGQTKEA